MAAEKPVLTPNRLGPTDTRGDRVGHRAAVKVRNIIASPIAPQT